MITEDYCSYEVAKLLKDKGFDGECYCHEFTDYEGNFTTYHTEYSENWNQLETCVSIPTLGMAMKWLREVCNVYMDIAPTHITNGAIQFVWQTYDSDYSVTGDCEMFYDSYEEAVEAALKYCLENLI